MCAGSRTAASRCGSIAQFLDVRHELMLRVAPEFFNVMQGTTDSELMFCLALAFGLKEDPVGALERMAGCVESVGQAHGIGAARRGPGRGVRALDRPAGHVAGDSRGDGSGGRRPARPAAAVQAG
jgi:hypothetical protein